MSESVIIYVNLTGKLTRESGVYRTGHSQRDSTDNYTIRGQECLKSGKHQSHRRVLRNHGRSPEIRVHELQTHVQHTPRQLAKRFPQLVLNAFSAVGVQRHFGAVACFGCQFR